MFQISAWRWPLQGRNIWLVSLLFLWSFVPDSWLSAFIYRATISLSRGCYVTKGGYRYVTALTPTYSERLGTSAWRKCVITVTPLFATDGDLFASRMPPVACHASNKSEQQPVTYHTWCVCVCDPRRLYASCLNSRIWRVYWHLSTLQIASNFNIYISIYTGSARKIYTHFNL